MAMENFTRKTARWFPSESRNNEGQTAVYSNRVKEMVKVLDFDQFGGAKSESITSRALDPNVDRLSQLGIESTPE